MSEKRTEPDLDTIPTAVVRRRRVSWSWLVPIGALVIVGYLLWAQVARDRGEKITIRFIDAGGLEPGSEIVHRGVTVGVVREIKLADDLSGVDVHAELVPDAEGLAVEGTSFWVVRAQVSLGRIAGLDTLIGPRYIAMRPGGRDQSPQRSFVALTEAPAADPPSDGSLRLILRSARLGTLSPGNPVLYREIRVGTVRDADLIANASAVEIHIEIDSRFVALIRENTRFWRSGGVGVDFGIFSGLSVQADSIESALSSSVSLATPNKPGKAVGSDHRFELSDEPDESWLKWKPRIELGG